MALPYGDWTATVNGAETILHIDPPDAQGVFTGQIFGGRIKGFWNEAAQKIQFASYAEEGGGTTSPVFGIFEGYLFRTPLNPAPGRDVTATFGGLVARQRAIRGTGCFTGDCPQFSQIYLRLDGAASGTAVGYSIAKMGTNVSVVDFDADPTGVSDSA